MKKILILLVMLTAAEVVSPAPAMASELSYFAVFPGAMIACPLIGEVTNRLVTGNHWQADSLFVFTIDGLCIMGGWLGGAFLINDDAPSSGAKQLAAMGKKPIKSIETIQLNADSLNRELHKSRDTRAVTLQIKTQLENLLEKWKLYNPTIKILVGQETISTYDSHTLFSDFTQVDTYPSHKEISLNSFNLSEAMKEVKSELNNVIYEFRNPSRSGTDLKYLNIHVNEGAADVGKQIAKGTVKVGLKETAIMGLKIVPVVGTVISFLADPDSSIAMDDFEAYYRKHPEQDPRSASGLDSHKANDAGIAVRQRVKAQWEMDATSKSIEISSSNVAQEAK